MSFYIIFISPDCILDLRSWPISPLSKLGALPFTSSLIGASFSA